MQLLTPTETELQLHGQTTTTPGLPSRARRIVTYVILLLPAVLVVWMGWRHRWTADDGFINFRIVRNVVDGHGPVFNIGQRVEVGTSPLWVAVLSALDVIAPLRLEWIAAISSLAATGGAVGLAVFGTRRTALTALPKGVTLLPLGALVYAALPPAWDFATSGLENGLGLLWIAVCWWLLCERVATGHREAGPRWWVPVVLSLGPLVRPDFSVFSVAFLVALCALCERRLATIARVIGLAAFVPVLMELGRMAYYGNVIPNTAIAKEAMASNWAQGWDYVRDYVSPYALGLPIVVLLGWWFMAAHRSGGITGRPDRIVALVVIAGAIVHGLYITRVGGDFMHARMLLATTFVLLLPVSVVAVQGRRGLFAMPVIAWALVCALWLRPSYAVALPHGVSAESAPVPYDRSTGIADERLFWIRTSGTSHPVTLDDYASKDVFARDGVRVAHWAKAGRRGLLLDPRDSARSLLPLRPGVSAAIVVSSGALGLFSYGAGDRVDVVDEYGLASPLAAHQRLERRGRPGHEKALSDAWLVAELADRHDALPTGVDPSEVTAARRALGCTPLRRLVTSPTQRFTPATAVDDLEGALSTSSFRFPPQPDVAAQEECGTGKR